jgi:hypothetical protein
MNTANNQKVDKAAYKQFVDIEPKNILVMENAVKVSKILHLIIWPKCI